jgi:hypothetical protein
MGEKRNAYRILVGKPGGKKQPGRPRHRWIITHPLVSASNAR